MNEVFALNRRLQPHLERYQTNLIDDPQYENDVSPQLNIKLNHFDFFLDSWAILIYSNFCVG